jgi:hypothetical protein
MIFKIVCVEKVRGRFAAHVSVFVRATNVDSTASGE